MQDIKVGDQVDFSKGSMKNNPRYAELGVCNVASITFARVWYHVEMVPVAGPRAGKIITWKLRNLDVFKTIAPFVKAATQETKKEVDAAYTKRYAVQSAKYERTTSLEIFPGDIVEVTDTRNGSKVDFRVYEIDTQKNRIKGWIDGRASYEIGSRMGYYSTAHDNVYTFKVVKPSAFVVKTDKLYLAYKQHTANAGEKRANTRARRSELRNRFGI